MDGRQGIVFHKCYIFLTAFLKYSPRSEIAESPDMKNFKVIGAYCPRDLCRSNSPSHGSEEQCWPPSPSTLSIYVVCLTQRAHLFSFLLKKTHPLLLAAISRTLSSTFETIFIDKGITFNGV